MKNIMVPRNVDYVNFQKHFNSELNKIRGTFTIGQIILILRKQFSFPQDYIYHITEKLRKENRIVEVGRKGHVRYYSKVTSLKGYSGKVNPDNKTSSNKSSKPEESLASEEWEKPAFKNILIFEEPPKEEQSVPVRVVVSNEGIRKHYETRLFIKKAQLAEFKFDPKKKDPLKDLLLKEIHNLEEILERLKLDKSD